MVSSEACEARNQCTENESDMYLHHLRSVLPAFFDQNMYKQSVHCTLYTFPCKTMEILYIVFQKFFFFANLYTIVPYGVQNGSLALDAFLTNAAKSLECVDSFIHLGSVISKDGSSQKDIKNKFIKARNALLISDQYGSQRHTNQFPSLQ